jgi:hypothetical protein
MKIKDIDTIKPRFIPKIHTKSWNVSFKVIDEEDYYKFYVSNSIADNSLYHPRQYEYGGFSIRNIDQVTYSQDSKSVIRKIDRQYRRNRISQIECNRRFVTEPLAIEFDS